VSQPNAIAVTHDGGFSNQLGKQKPACGMFFSHRWSLWHADYEGSGHGSDEAAAVVVDGSGNVMVAGYEAVSYGDSA
jgi:hypothetical protein